MFFDAHIKIYINNIMLSKLSSSNSYDASSSSSSSSTKRKSKKLKTTRKKTRDAESVFKCNKIVNQSKEQINETLDEAVHILLENEEDLDTYLGKHVEENKPLQLYQSDTNELFYNYVSFVMDVMNLDIDIESIKHDILKGAFYMNYIDDAKVEFGESVDNTLINLIHSYRGDPDADDFFEDDVDVGPISYLLAAHISISSENTSIPLNFSAKLRIWKEEDDERIPDEAKLSDLFTRQIESQYALSRYLHYWPITASSPFVVFTGIAGAYCLPEYQKIKQLELNETMMMPYFVSTSYDINVAKKFSGMYKEIFCIVIHTGFQLPVVSATTDQGNEREILLNIGARLQKTKEPFEHDGYTYFCYTLVGFDLPKRRKIGEKVRHATQVWRAQLGL